MNKHFIGLIIFSFIIGISAIIASLFIQMPQMPEIQAVKVSESNDYVYRGNTYCQKKKKRHHPKQYNDLASVKVSQAFFDLDQKQLETQIMVERANDSTETVNIALHFFVNDRFGVQHIATEFVTLTPNFDIGDKAITTKISSYRWLNNLESRENLYVMPVVGNDYYNSNEFTAVFNSSEATAVLTK